MSARIFTLCFCLLLQLHSQPARKAARNGSLPTASEGSGIRPDQIARIPPRMQFFVDRGDAAGVVTMLVHDGRTVLLDARGYQNLDEKKPMRADSIFQIMSMTKPVTGAAVMMLVDEGKLTLTDPVEKYLPEFKDQMVRVEKDGREAPRKPSRPIRIVDLMTHTSGMTGPHEPIKDLYQTMHMTLDEAVRIFAKEPLAFDPGTKWQYSNPGIATLGRLIEVASGEKFEEFLADRLFKPLGMKDSFIFLPADKRDRVAMLYRPTAGKFARAGADSLGGDPAKFREGARYSAPEFAMYSTAQDLAAFYQMMLKDGVFNGQRLLSKAAVRTMTMSHTGDLIAGHVLGSGFGLTFEVTTQPLGTALFLPIGAFHHGGAFGTFGWIDRKSKLVGVFLVQRSGGTQDARNAFIQMAEAAVE